MKLKFTGIPKPKLKTFLIVLGICIVTAGLTYGIEDKIKQRLCLFEAPGIQCEMPVLDNLE